MEVVLLLIRIFLFVVFVVAGIGKMLDLEGAEKASKDFGVPEDLAKPFSVLLPTAEIIFAVMLLFISTSWVGAVGGFLLLAAFIGGIIWQMAKGKTPDCHCFGAIHSEPISKKTVVRNGVLAAAAFFLVAQGWNNQGLSFAELTDQMALELILGLGMAGLLGAVIFYLKKISEQQTQIIRRIDVLEVISHEGAEVKREDVAPPAEGLPIGAAAPDFVLPNIGGREVSFENLLTKAKPLMFFFVSPTCNPCGALLPEIENWGNQLKDKLEIIFISSGNAADNTAKLGGGTLKEILLQKDREVAQLFGALWTPTAILINADGTIGSHLAAGDAAIRELFENISAVPVEEGMIFVKNENGAQHLGEKFPEFTVNDVNGESVSTENLIGKKTLLTYWGLDCGWCGQMLEDLREWDAHRGLDEPDLLLLSSGDAERHKALGFRGHILLDDEKALPEALGLTGTPSAILINENGRIVSEVAAGAENIWNLIGKKKKI